MTGAHVGDSTRAPQTLVVGIGSPHGDDQAGWLVAKGIESTINQANVTIRQAASPAHLLDWLDGVGQLIICDACRGLAGVGEVARWTWPTSDIPDIAWSGTHDLSLPAVLALARQLRCLPQEIVVWAIEGATSDLEESLSAGVLEAVREVVDRVIRELNDTEPVQAKACTSSR